MRITEQEFSEVYKKYRKALVRRARGLLKDNDNADDLVQELFKSLLKHEEYEKIKDNLSSWLMTICLYNSISFARKKNTRSRIYTEYGFTLSKYATEINAFEYSCLLERKRLLHEAIAGLTQLQQEILILRYFEDMSYIDIAKKYNKKVSAVSTMLARTIKNIKPLLDKDLWPTK
jgi:RNA polymerase sigma-70 factor (ECF subfamily)